MTTRHLLFAASLLAAAHIAYAQGLIDGKTNLIVNGGAEAGTAGTPTTLVASIPGWTRSGNANVLPYGLTGRVLLSDPAPPDHGFNYFVGATDNHVSTLTQDIDVSSGASTISGGNVKYTASVYLGGIAGDSVPQVTVAFKNANGQTFSSATLGPAGFNGAWAGLSLQQQIGLVPPGAARITVTLSLNNAYAVADSLSLVLNTLGPPPVLGRNLVVNPGAEAGPSAPPHTSTALYVPGWSTANRTSVAPYGGTGWIAVSDLGPADRGVNLFCGGDPGSTMYQDIDVSPAVALIDSPPGVTYEISAWLGAAVGATSPTLTYTFFDWTGTQLAPTAQLGPISHTGAGLIEASHSDTLPPGTRRVHIALSFPNYFYVADDINFTLAAPPGPPVIISSTHPGIESASGFGGLSAIAPGTWIEIYGAYLTSSPLRNNCPGVPGSCWTGADFNNGVGPTSLDGVSVSIGGAAAFIDYTSPAQVNALVPSDAPVGPSMITLTNSSGISDPFPIYVNQTEPGLLAPPGTFVINGKQYVAALFSDGSFALPQNAIPGVASRPAKAGETITFYGIGFGPVIPDFPAGTVVTQQNTLKTPLQFLFGNTAVTPGYFGLAPSFTGLYQFNVVVPNVGANNALPISINLGGVKGSQTLYIAVQN
jgi:uncharacterized protein (TIGR03437 family)